MEYSREEIINLRIIIGLMLVLPLVFFLSSCSSNNQPTTSGTITPVSYANDVAPIFEQNCLQCHSGSQPSGRLDLSSYAGIMAGGGTGQVVNPDDAGGSLLVSMVRSGQMPKVGTKLTPDQVTILENWINSGAKDN